MKITLEKGVLEIPDGFSFELKVTHPFFSEEGCATIPMTIPTSYANSFLLNRPERMDHSTRPLREYSGMAECGLFRKRVKLAVDSAGNSSGITLSMMLNESAMYAEVQDRKLKDLFTGMAFASTKTVGTSPWEVYKCGHLTNLYFPDLALFPVASDHTEDGNYFIINQPDGKNSDIVHGERTVTIGDQSVAVYGGYGICPYYFLWGLIERTFDNLGYTIKYNVFKEDIDLRCIVVLHTHADVCMESYGIIAGEWTFEYSDLVPDITVGELIVFLRDKFGAFVTADEQSISIRLFRDVVKREADYDLTEYLITDEIITYPEPTRLERGQATDIESGEPAAESLEDLRHQYQELSQCVFYGNISNEGLNFVAPIGKYYHRDSAGMVRRLGSDSFPYTRHSDLPAESIDTDDIFVPQVETAIGNLPYIGNRTHLYLNTNEDKPEQKIMICYGHDIDEGLDTIHMCGSSRSYDENGNQITYRTINENSSIIKKPHPTLTPEGLSVFWSDYERLLLNGSPTVTAEFRIPIGALTSIDAFTPKIFKGCRVLIKEMTYAITDEMYARVKMELQTLPLYTDSISPSPVVFNTTLSWTIMNTRKIWPSENCHVVETDGLSDYTDADAPSYIPRVLGIISKRRRRWVKYLSVYWNPNMPMQVVFEEIVHEWDEYFISES